MHPSLLVGLVLLVACESKWEPTDSGATGAGPPEVYLTEPALGSTWSVLDAIAVRAVITDDVDAPETLAVEIRSDLAGVLASPTLTSDGQLDTTLTLDAGTHELTVAATDSTGGEGSDSSTIRVTDSDQPTQPGIDLEPTSPVTGDDLVASIVVESVDPEGDAVTYRWSWTADGVDAAIDEATAGGALVSAGQTWEVTVIATDGTNESAPATRSVLVGNAPPDPGTVAISPEDPAPGDTLVCTHDTPVDAEGDAFTVSYAWTVNGEDVGESSDTLERALERGDLVVCAVVVDDGVATTWESAAVQVGNAAPTVGSVEVSPDTATEETTLTCTALAVSDADGDAITLTYQWWVGGAASATGTSIDGASFARGDGVACEVTPADAWSSGDPATSATLTVANTPPTAPVVAFVQTDLIPGATAECVVATDATDADGDALAYGWAWDVDGSVSAVTTATFDTTGTDSGATLRCTATADDGYEAGDGGSAEVILGAPTSGDVAIAAADTVITGTATNGNFGKAVDVVDDIDGDGLAELVVSAQRGDGGSLGAAYVFTAASLAAGGTLADTDATWWWTGHSSDDYLGATRGAAGAGDCDDDGLGDVLLAAPYEDTAGAEAGMAYLLYGGESWTVGGDVFDDAEARFTGRTGDWLGARMSSGDLDADGISDFVLTGPYNDLEADKAGIMAVFMGTTSRYNGTVSVEDADALVTGAASGTELGWALDVLGDMDGDGYADVAVGIFYDDTNEVDAGAAAVITGSELAGQDTFEDVAFLVVHGIGAGDRFGYDVGGVGDVDDDGLDDVAFGAYLSDDAGADAGSVALFFGAAGLDREVDADEADATFAGESAGDQFGSLIAAAGDFDADGVADFMVGGPRSSASGASASGSAYLYLGASAASWDTDPDYDARFLGDADDDWVSDEGVAGFDLSGDGYDDLAIGAQGSDLGATGGGAVFVFGGP